MNNDAFSSQEGAIKSVLATTADVPVSSVQLQSFSQILPLLPAPPPPPPPSVESNM
jgi:hypothetical protein